MNKETIEKEIKQCLQNKPVDGINNDLVGYINSLPNTIELPIGGEDSEKSEIYYAIVVKTDHEISKDNSYIAMYSKRTRYGMSYRDYLFCVRSSNANDVLNKFIIAYYELLKRKFIQDRIWICKYKCLNLFSNGNTPYEIG